MRSSWQKVKSVLMLIVLETISYNTRLLAIAMRGKPYLVQGRTSMLRIESRIHADCTQNNAEKILVRKSLRLVSEGQRSDAKQRRVLLKFLSNQRRR